MVVSPYGGRGQCLHSKLFAYETVRQQDKSLELPRESDVLAYLDVLRLGFGICVSMHEGN
jgi:hypothetical protein